MARSLRDDQDVPHGVFFPGNVISQSSLTAAQQTVNVGTTTTAIRLSNPQACYVCFEQTGLTTEDGDDLDLDVDGGPSLDLHAEQAEVATVANSVYLPADAVEVFAVEEAASFSVIRASTDGVLNITELA